MRKTLSLVLLLFLLIGCGKNTLLPVKQEEKKEQGLESAKESKEQDCPEVLIKYVYPSRWTAGRIITTVAAVAEVALVSCTTYFAREQVCNFDFNKNATDKIIMCVLYGLTFLTGLGAILR
jgi:hypothetical protein